MKQQLARQAAPKASKENYSKLKKPLTRLKPKGSLSGLKTKQYYSRGGKTVEVGV